MSISRLTEEEQKIVLEVLNGSHPELSTDESFKNTTLAIYNIIRKKLYKERFSSLEMYFRTTWNLSRAHAYRLYYCAKVLLDLYEFPILPLRERFCRTIAKFAKTTDQRKILWRAVLQKVSDRYDLVSSGVIGTVWQELIRKGEVINLAGTEIEIDDFEDIEEYSTLSRKDDSNDLTVQEILASRDVSRSAPTELPLGQSLKKLDLDMDEELSVSEIKMDLKYILN